MEVYSPGGNSNLREEALKRLHEAKKLEASHTNLVRVPVLNGYAMTRDVKKWQTYNEENAFEGLTEKMGRLHIADSVRTADSETRNMYKI